MESNWASEHLQVIRTLMERSALYRRALAPIMIVVGSIGVAAAAIPCWVEIKTSRAFALYWMAVSVVAAAAAFLLVRRQALKEAEPFWSLPTRRVSQALLPGFVVGLVTGVLMATLPSDTPSIASTLAVVWVLAYGCALNAAGFFVQRGIRLLGWIFIVGGCVGVAAVFYCPSFPKVEAGHYVMGSFFGLLHLAYGIYLYFTEKAKRVA